MHVAGNEQYSTFKTDIIPSNHSYTNMELGVNENT